MIKATEQGVLLTATKHVWKNSGNRKRTIRAVSDSPFSLISSAFRFWFLRIASDFLSARLYRILRARSVITGTFRYSTLLFAAYHSSTTPFSLSSVYPFHLSIGKFRRLFHQPVSIYISVLSTLIYTPDCFAKVIYFCFP